jgi:hypothetical protein
VHTEATADASPVQTRLREAVSREALRLDSVFAIREVDDHVRVYSTDHFGKPWLCIEHFMPRTLECCRTLKHGRSIGML